MSLSSPATRWRPGFRAAKFILACCALGMFAQIAHAAPRHVLLLTPAGGTTEAITLAQQTAEWQRSGLIANALVLERDTGNEATFDAVAILELAGPDDVTELSQVAAADFGPTVDFIPVDLVGSVGKLDASAAAAYVVMQYTVSVPRAEFEEYIDGYQVPEMVARLDAGGLAYYRSFYVPDGSKTAWRSILLMEYRTQSDLEDSGPVNKAIGQHLAEVDPNFRKFKETKDSIRTKIATVQVNRVIPVVANADHTLRMPPTECQAWVGYDRDTFLNGYLIPTATGETSCVSFTQTATQPPAGYTGADFYVDEFTDSKLRERWWQCMDEPECRDRIVPHVKRRAPPGRDHAVTDPHKLWLLGKIDAENPRVDLESIRRPAFFAADPWREEIATAEGRTFTIELTVEPEPYERIVRHRTENVKLRGWYLQGKGIDDGHGGKTRALIIISAGGGGRLVAISHPLERLYNIDPATGKSVLNSYPNEYSGASSQRHWRQLLLDLNNAGFDVLSYDRRGAGVSGGYGDTNTLQQGRDLLTNITNLKSGIGLRVLSPAGVEYAGAEASAALLAGADGARLPIVLAGISRGTMASGWAMTRNFFESCDYDLEEMPCGPPLEISNIKGAMMIAGFTSGVGYVTSPTSQDDMDRGLFIAGTELEAHTVFQPSSGILAGVHAWPALFIGRGLWDYAESLEGSVAAYDRVAGLKELLVVRGPHPFETWPESERARTVSRMIAFAGAAVRSQETAPGARTWSNLKELVGTASNVWETSSFPHPVPGECADDAGVTP